MVEASNFRRRMLQGVARFKLWTPAAWFQRVPAGKEEKQLDALRRGWSLYQASQPMQAIDAFQEAYQAIGGGISNKAAAEIEAGLGWCWHSRQSWVKSSEHFERAVIAKPDLADAWKGLGLSRYSQQQFAHAEHALDRCLQINPQAVDVVAWLGWCAFAVDDLQTAASRFAAALQHNPLHDDTRRGATWCNQRKQNADSKGIADHPAWPAAPTLKNVSPDWSSYLPRSA